ncbi:hypothetical protein D3C87_1481880 [compost metagenome]
MNSSALPFLREEGRDDRCNGLRPGHQEQMAIADHMQLRIGNAPGQQAHVGQRNDRVVIAGQNQGRLMDPVQPVNTGPAQARQQLQVVTAPAAGTHLAGERLCQCRVMAKSTAIDVRRDPRAIGRLDVTARSGHPPEHFGFGRQHGHARTRGGQDQFLATLRKIVGELLCQRSPPGHADHVDLANVQIIEHARNPFRQVRKPVRQARQGGAADTGHVEGDHFHVRIKRPDEWKQKLQVGANAIED